jgi:DNA-binding MarR family transcriptional regulator
LSDIDSALPLPTLLSQALVAFTVVFDNEFEHRMPHRTTSQGTTSRSRHARWLTSLVMWSSCLRYVGSDGLPVREVQRLAGTTSNLAGLERWGYITVEPDPADSRPKPPRADWLVASTRAGRKAREVWEPLPGVIEERWRERFGATEIERLRAALVATVDQFDMDLPDYPPILGYGLFTTVGRHGAREPAVVSQLPLVTLLGRAQVAFGARYDGKSRLALAIGANVLRILDEHGTRMRELPQRSGVSKESISMAMSFLLKHELVVQEPEKPGSRTKIARLTPAGVQAKDDHSQRLGTIEDGWRARFGADTTRELRAALAQLVGDPAARSPLFGGLEPYPDGWRASVRRPDTLPHYPMVLHRGGYPDGS